MASVLLSPIGNSGNPFFDNNGLPLAGGLVYTYQAGSSTLLTTYTTVNGTIANTNPIVLDAFGRPPSEVWLQTGYSYKFVIKTSTSVTLTTLDNIYPILQNGTSSGITIPSGLIAIWSGAVGSVPSGWTLCDGTNGAPDLRNSFVMGAGSTYSVGQTGGTADSIVVSHNHTATVTDPGHSHKLFNTDGSGPSISSNSALYCDYLSGNAYYAYDIQGTTTVPTLGPSETKTTGVTVANTATGVSGTGANIPPYYALAYIMKT